MPLRVPPSCLHRATFAVVLLLLPASSLALSPQTPAPASQPATVQAPDTTPAMPPIQRKPQKRPGPACTSAEEASRSPNKEACVSVHVYDVVELSDGTRFLDVCPPDAPDDQCRFTLVSLHQDREDVGDLRKYRDQDVSVRGIVRVTHGRMGIVISHLRQFDGGPERFRPNPRLLRGFNAQSERAPVRDPNLAPSGRHRSFMNTHDTETLPQAPKR